jgi:hypothetical protein
MLISNSQSDTTSRTIDACPTTTKDSDHDLDDGELH